MASYENSDRIAEIARKVIAENEKFHHLDDPNCRIAYQTADYAKINGQKIVYDDTERVKDKYKRFIQDLCFLFIVIKNVIADVMLR